MRLNKVYSVHFLRRPAMRLRLAFLSAGFAVAAAAVALLLAPTQAAKPENHPVPVRVAVAAPAARAGEIRSTGTLAFKREITLSFKASGIVKSFTADSGDAVKAGAVLAQLNPTEVGARDLAAIGDPHDHGSPGLRAEVDADRVALAHRSSFPGS